MNIDAILEKIAADARSDAEATLGAARDKAAAMQDASKAADAQRRAQTLSEAEREAAVLRDRMLRMANLEARKRLLAMKREEIDRAFEMALQKMLSMQQSDARAFLSKVLQSVAQGNETIVVSQKDAALYDGAFLASVNAQLTKAGKAGALRLSDSRREERGGFTLSLDGVEMDCGYSALLRAARERMEGEIAAILFPA